MKSNERKRASDLLEMVDVIYRDATTKCGADVSDFRSLKTIRDRVEHEGLSFLTITLPQFAKDLEQALAKGQIDATHFKRFKREKGAVMPAFLQEITRHIFDAETGKVKRNEHSPENGDSEKHVPTCIESVRQLCLTFKKVELDCSPTRIASAFSSFVSIEQSFESFSVPNDAMANFLAVADLLWNDRLADFQPANCTPRHGPGATADRIKGNQKYVWQYWYDRLEPYFPIIDNGYPLGIRPTARLLRNVTIVTQNDELPVRVVAVPKTLKSPRIIAIEPTCMQYVQQGIRDYLYGKIESDEILAGHINFSDQTVNQRLALDSSTSGQLATIDLSDASDRVPWSLAMSMFRGWPTYRKETSSVQVASDLYRSIDACRSTKALLPDGTIVSPLRKFASMGSALCFPVEAMYFYTICVIALLKDNDLPICRANIETIGKDIYVYGDDLIVPAANAPAVLEHLQEYNCKVNTSKSFWSGNFRESCGVDAYDGYPVTPVYLRMLRPESRRQASRIISWVATANLFYKKGYWLTTQFIRSKIDRLVGPLPYVSETSGALGYISALGYRTVSDGPKDFATCWRHPKKAKSRWNGDLQRFEIKALVPEPARRTDVLKGYGALTKCFLSMKSSSTDDELHDWRVKVLSAGSEEFALIEHSLERSVLRGAVALKRRWVPVQLG